MAESHLMAEEAAAYIDHRLSSEDTARATAHLADCSECRRELAEASRLLAAAPQAVGRRRYLRVASFAAAAVILLAVVLARPERRWTEGPVERASTVGEASSVRAVYPRNGAIVELSTLTFAWHRDDDASYRLSVVDSAGAVLWVTTTTDTSAQLPATVRLLADSRYFWYVDALRADGFSVSSGPLEFTTAR